MARHGKVEKVKRFENRRQSGKGPQNYMKETGINLQAFIKSKKKRTGIYDLWRYRHHHPGEHGLYEVVDGAYNKRLETILV
jgi:hypothetical protein